MKYSISRYEEKSDQLFICINHTEKPVYVEHFFSPDERKDEKSKIATIEKLVAELEIKADEYVEPEAWVDKRDSIKDLKISVEKVATQKALILSSREENNELLSSGEIATAKAELLLAKEVEDDETK